MGLSYVFWAFRAPFCVSFHRPNSSCGPGSSLVTATRSQQLSEGKAALSYVCATKRSLSYTLSYTLWYTLVTFRTPFVPLSYTHLLSFFGTYW